MWQAHAAPLTAVSFPRRGRGRASVAATSLPRPRCVGSRWGRGSPRGWTCRAPPATPTRAPTPHDRSLAVAGAVSMWRQQEPSRHTVPGDARRRRCLALVVLVRARCTLPAHLLRYGAPVTCTTMAAATGDTSGAAACCRGRHDDCLPPSRMGRRLPPDILGTCGTGPGPLRHDRLRPSDDTGAASEGVDAGVALPWARSARLRGDSACSTP